MAKTADYIISGPLSIDPFMAQCTQKSLPIRRDTKKSPTDLRELYRTSADTLDDENRDLLKNVIPHGLPHGLPTTPNLPPTPPSGNSDPLETVALVISSEAAPTRSTPVTPVNQNNPPTPDDTPPAEPKRPVPRPFLGMQPSLASTHAESFRTAREEFVSDDDSVDDQELGQPNPRATRLPSRNLNGIYPDAERTTVAPPPQPSRLRLETSFHDVLEEPSPAVTAVRDAVTTLTFASGTPVADLVSSRPTRAYSPSPPRVEAHPATADQASTRPIATSAGPVMNGNARRGPSLRDRLEAVDKASPSASTEKFANIIGWNSAVADVDVEKRWSGASNTSAISAMVFESVTLPKKRTTIRKVAKHDSLRAASSPLPASQAAVKSDCLHRLVHKKAKLCNDNRWSFGSDPTRSLSMSCTQVPRKPEIIKVAIIPERRSSLQSSTQSSKRHSLSEGSARTQSGKPPSSWQRKRTASESHSDRGRQQGPPQIIVPPRSSSLSAPTSRNTSRANSMTSGSELFRKRRKDAESDLRRTLDRMESDRLVSSLNTVHMQATPQEPSSKPQRPSVSSQTDRKFLHASPGTTEWADLRPPSVLETPFSQPSYRTASPELRDATTVNIFPHNNNSLQLIEPNIAPESWAVREVRKLDFARDEVPSTQSPLRQPRQAPPPPAFDVVGTAPEAALRREVPQGRSQKRSTHSRSQSFVQSLTRGFSVRNAQNRKKGQQLDASSHPFWRPQGFWEAFEEPHPRPGEEVDMQVHNSLGMRQERVVVRGPVSLVRRISQRRRRGHQPLMLTQQMSSSSLARLQASHKLYRSSLLSFHLPFLRMADMRDRVLYAKQRKENERRERIRQDIRSKIGKEVVRQGDSRFLKSRDSMQEQRFHR